MNVNERSEWKKGWKWKNSFEQIIDVYENEIIYLKLFPISKDSIIIVVLFLAA